MTPSSRNMILFLHLFTEMHTSTFIESLRCQSCSIPGRSAYEGPSACSPARCKASTGGRVPGKTWVDDAIIMTCNSRPVRFPLIRIFVLVGVRSSMLTYNRSLSALFCLTLRDLAGLIGLGRNVPSDISCRNSPVFSPSRFGAYPLFAL